MSSGGGGGAPTEQTVYQSSLPEYAEPYFKDVMGRAQSASLTPFQQYGGERVAGFTPAQQAAFGNVAGLAAAGTPAGAVAGQEGVAGALGAAQGFGYDPSTFTEQQVTGGQLDPLMSITEADRLQQFMDPYMQAVVDRQKEAALREYQIADQMRSAQAIQSAAFGGSREAVQAAESQRALMSQLQDIQATGSQQAFEQAVRAMEAERAAQMQAGQFDISTAMQADLANQQAALEAQRATEQSRQFGASTGLEAIGMQGTLGGQLAAMGADEQRMALERAAALGDVGAQQQALEQAQLDQAYADFAAQRDYEQNMINWYNSILRGTPVTPEQTVYSTAASPSLAAQLGGLGIAGVGLAGGGQ